MLVPFVKILKTGRDYALKQILINPNQITYVQEDEGLKRKLDEGTLSLGLHKSTGFSKIRLDNSGFLEEIIVIGTPDMVQKKIEASSRASYKQLLQG